jgi:type I restriction enzyme S subunit
MSVSQVRLDSVAIVNKTSVNPKKEFDWINYTDISSVGPHTVGAPTRFEVAEAPGRARRVLTIGDIALSTVRPNRRSFFKFTGQWDRAICSTGFAVVSAHESRDSDYLYAYLTSKEATSHYESICEGGAYPAFNGALLNEMTIPWPSEEERLAIGGISQLIREKILVNGKLAAKLEEFVQATFKSWFIDFLPVHANAAGDNPEMLSPDFAALFPSDFEEIDGEIVPSGWKVSRISEICERLVNGSTPSRKRKDYWSPRETDWFKTGELADGFLLDSGESVSQLGIQKSSVKVLPAGAVLMAIYAAPTVGRLGILTKDACFNQACTGMVAKSEIGTPFLFMWLKFRREYFNSLATGTGQQNISKGVVEDCPILVPTPELISVFNSVAVPIFGEIEQLTKQNEVLSSLHDLLIPRLIAGDLAIPEDWIGI